MDFGNLEGLIPLFGGLYALLIVHNKVKVKNKDFVEKHRKLMLICGIGCIIFGIATIFGLLNAR